MIYLFEDDYRDVKSELIANTYYGDLSKLFRCSVSKMRHAAAQYLEATDDRVLCWFDLSVHNRNSFDEYHLLRKLAYKYPNRLMCLPIPCFEYYFVRGIDDRLIRLQNDVNVVRNLGYYFNTTVFDENQLKCKNFENFCKLVLLLGFKDCVKGNSSCSYFVDDCDKDECDIISVLDKVRKVADEFPVLPKEFGWSKHRGVSLDEIFTTHKELVAKFAEVSAVYRELDSSFNYRDVPIFPLWC